MIDDPAIQRLHQTVQPVGPPDPLPLQYNICIMLWVDRYKELLTPEGVYKVHLYVDTSKDVCIIENLSSAKVLQLLEAVDILADYDDSRWLDKITVSNVVVYEQLTITNQITADKIRSVLWQE